MLQMDIQPMVRKLSAYTFDSVVYFDHVSLA